MSYAAHAARCVRPSWNSILEADFTKDAYSRPGRRSGKFTDLPNSSFSRALAGYAQDSGGVWQQAASGIYRRTDRGVLIEEARANLIRNSSMAGAGVGVAPNLWAALSTSRGITENIVGVGTEYGLPYVDYRLLGTASSTGNLFQNFDGVGSIAASAGQFVAISLLVKLIANLGTAPNLIRVAAEPRDAAGNQTLTGATYPIATFTPTASVARFSAVAALSATAGTIGSVLPWVSFGVVSGQSYDYTVRIYCPQLEVLSATTAQSSSPVLTTSAALTRPKDAMRLTSTPLPAAWTIYAEAEFLGSTGANQSLIYVSAAGSSNDRCFLYRDSLDRFVCGSVCSGANVLSRTGVTVAGAATAKMALSFDGTTWRGACNGSGVTSTAGVGPAVQLDQIDLGQNNGANNQLNGYLRRVSIRPYAAAQAELNALTA